MTPNQGSFVLMGVIYHCIIIHFHIQKAFYISPCNLSFLCLQIVTFVSTTRSYAGAATIFTWYQVWDLHSWWTKIQKLFLQVIKDWSSKKMDLSQQIILTPFNWHEWKPIILRILRSKDIYKITMRTEPKLNSAIENIKYFNRIDEAYGILYLSISPNLLFHVKSATTPNEVWTTYWTTLEGLFHK